VIQAPTAIVRMGEDRFCVVVFLPISPETGYFFMAYSTADERYMIQALRLAAKGLGKTSPNPVVGCVVVKDGQIIAGDYHHKAGQPHAEALALPKAGAEAKGADLYVTLEPCCIYGRTPPCTDAIIKAGIKRVVAGALDPNPKVNGKGISILKNAGVEVVTGVLGRQCEKINRPYFKYAKTGLPYVTVKFAQSLDGRIATKNGSSKWISSEKSLVFAHKLRALNDAILIGANTANHDDPQLTVRLASGRNPIRIILTSSGRLTKNLRLLNDKSARTIIATGKSAKTFANTETIRLPQKGDSLDLKVLLKVLAKMEITSLLVEGGSGAITGFLKQKLADKIIIVSAPILIGDGISAIGDLQTKTIAHSLKLKDVEYKHFGPDCVISGELN
jgi:diaminohydroxyphosphoribosylaminopyrimidine deaminase/5-amino-6-(5-phosphoribosylamino)uracil reductase